jgi:hypothetical protein
MTNSPQEGTEGCFRTIFNNKLEEKATIPFVSKRVRPDPM